MRVHPRTTDREVLVCSTDPAVTAPPDEESPIRWLPASACECGPRALRVTVRPLSAYDLAQCQLGAYGTEAPIADTQRAQIRAGVVLIERSDAKLSSPDEIVGYLGDMLDWRELVMLSNDIHARSSAGADPFDIGGSEHGSGETSSPESTGSPVRAVG